MLNNVFELYTWHCLKLKYMVLRISGLFGDSHRGRLMVTLVWSTDKEISISRNGNIISIILVQ